MAATPTGALVRVGECVGHTSDVACLDVSQAGTQLVSGGEDGLRLWDLRSPEAAAVGHVQLKSGAESGVTSVCCSKKDGNLIWASVSTSIMLLDARKMGSPVCTVKVNADEVNHITLNTAETLLAAADDSGEIRIIDTSSKALFKTLRKQHKNICSSVQFSPTKPDELFSGSLDCSIVRWDFKTLKCIHRVDTNDPDAAQGVNPPMVHSLAASPSGCVAAALGDGSVLYTTPRARGGLQWCRIAGAHSYSTSQVHFPTLGSGGSSSSVLLSGGNDKKIVVHAPPEAGSLDWVPRAHIQHTDKINWITSLKDGIVAVADCSPAITLYRLA
jgi:WD40 repeat protein